jgi:hypothetical protein
MTGMHQGLSAARPLPSRSHPPALKRGTFYFAQKRNFLLCLDTADQTVLHCKKLNYRNILLHQRCR